MKLCEHDIRFEAPPEIAENTLLSVADDPRDPDVALIRLDIAFPGGPSFPGTVKVGWNIPCTDIFSTSSASSVYERNIAPSWRPRVTSSRLASGAPLHQLVSSGGRNRMTVALSDAANACEIRTCAREHTCEISTEVRFFTQTSGPFEKYSAVIRVDFSDRPFYDSLKAAVRFWEEECGYPALFVPEAARRPLYSCWYSFHQAIDEGRILDQCRLAKRLGMESVIVDDGWQCDGVNVGYTGCGDWIPSPAKVADMKSFVDAVHATGLKFILWYSLPAAGKYSKARERFADMLLNPSANSWSSLDPRFPEVREYLAGTIGREVREWGLDGIKLDFIDSFKLFPDTPASDPRRDCASLESGVDRLLDAVTKAVKAVRPDILIEFRQSYFGPVIRKYGNMIRVGDCPADSIRNRIAGTDLRFMTGRTAVHSDMLMWHPDDDAASAAYQVICTLFTVPQISVLLDRIPQSHVAMLRFYLGFWNRLRDVLLDGCLEAEGPESGYSMIRSSRDGVTVAVSYTDPVLKLGSFRAAYHVNATPGDELYVRFAGGGRGRKRSRPYTFRVLDCTGSPVSSGVLPPSTELARFEVPRCGMLKLS